MSKLRSSAPASQPPVTNLPDDVSTSRHQRPARDGKVAVGHADPLPWLIRQLRGRYDVGRIAPPTGKHSSSDSGDNASHNAPPS